MNARGFGTLEAIVAAALLAVVAAAVTSTLVLARRLQGEVAAERHATLLATASLERLRSGNRDASMRVIDGFTVVETVHSWNGTPRLLDVRVRVSWMRNQARSIELRTLMFR